VSPPIPTEAVSPKAGARPCHAGDLGGVGGSHDRSGVPVDGWQEDAARRVVAGLAGTDYRPGKLGPKQRDREA
jgi:hypothetical protein